MARKKTNEEFVKEVFDLVENKYTFLEEYNGANTKIKCKHNECGYEWRIIPHSFLHGARCPKCSKKQRIAKTRKTHGQFEKEFYNAIGSEYNLLSTYINSRSKIKVRHNVCGHEWELRANDWTKGNRCPKCQSDLVGFNLRKTHEQFEGDVFDLVQNQYIFLEKYIDARTKIKCKHNICGHEWSVLPNLFLQGTRCPSCNAQKQTKTNENFIQEVRELVGNEYIFLEEYINAQTQILCKHNVCDYEWYTTPNGFLCGSRCPQCNRPNYHRDTEQFKREIYELVGDEYTLIGEYINAVTKTKIKHNNCNHTYYAKPNDFLNGNRCPQCAESKGEGKIRMCLESLDIEYKPQYSFSDCKNILPLSFDFYLPWYNLLIEYDGIQHFEPVDFAGRGEEWAKERFEYTKQNDYIKNQYCKDNNIPLIRIAYWQFDEVEQILDKWLNRYNIANIDVLEKPEEQNIIIK